MKKPTLITLTRLGVVLGIVLLFLWAMGSQALPFRPSSANYRVLDQDWSQIIEGQARPLDSLEDVEEIPVGEDLTLEITLPALTRGQVLFFYSVNQEVVVTFLSPWPCPGGIGPWRYWAWWWPSICPWRWCSNLPLVSAFSTPYGSTT